MREEGREGGERRRGEDRGARMQGGKDVSIDAGMFTH